MSFEQRAKILEIAQSSQCSVTEIVHVLKLKNLKRHFTVKENG
jgi:hypothetical protein